MEASVEVMSVLVIFEFVGVVSVPPCSVFPGLIGVSLDPSVVAPELIVVTFVSDVVVDPKVFIISGLTDVPVSVTEDVGLTGVCCVTELVV